MVQGMVHWLLHKISQHGDTSNKKDVKPFCSAIKGFASDLRTQVPYSDRQNGQIGPFLEKVDHPEVSVIFCMSCRATGHFSANCHLLASSETYLIYPQYFCTVVGDGKWEGWRGWEVVEVGKSAPLRAVQLLNLLMQIFAGRGA